MRALQLLETKIASATQQYRRFALELRDRERGSGECRGRLSTDLLLVDPPLVWQAANYAEQFPAFAIEKSELDEQENAGTCWIGCIVFVPVIQVFCCHTQAFGLWKLVLKARRRKQAIMSRTIAVFQNSKAAMGFRTWLSFARLERFRKLRSHKLASQTAEAGIGLVALGRVEADREELTLEVLASMKAVGGALQRDGATVDESAAPQPIAVRKSTHPRFGRLAGRYCCLYMQATVIPDPVFSLEQREAYKPPSDLPVPLADLLEAPAVDSSAETPELNALVDEVLNKKSTLNRRNPACDSLYQALRRRAENRQSCHFPRVAFFVYSVAGDSSRVCRVRICA
jgi:hypothetical protein